MLKISESSLGSSTFWAAFFLFLATHIAIVAIYVRSEEHAKENLANSPLEKAFRQSSLGIIFTACYCTVSSVIPTCTDLLLDALMTWKPSVDDWTERIIVVVLQIVPAIAFLQFSQQYQLSVVFIITNVFQICGCYAIILGFFNKLYPSEFRPWKVFTMQMFMSFCGIFSVLGIGASPTHGLRIATYVSIFISGSLFAHTVHLVWFNNGLYGRIFKEKLDPREVYFVAYACALSAKLTVVCVVGGRRHFAWELMDFSDVVTILFSFIAFTVCICAIPARVTRETLHSQHQQLQSDALVIRVKEQIIRFLSHEIRSPLNVIKALSGFVIQDAEAGECNVSDVNESLRNILSSCEAAEGVLDDLYRYDQRDSPLGSPLLTSVVFGARALQSMVQATVGGAAHRKDVALHSSWRPSEALALRLDAPKLEHAFGAILKEVLKFTPEGTSLHVTAELKPLHPSCLTSTVKGRVAQAEKWKFSSFIPNWGRFHGPAEGRVVPIHIVPHTDEEEGRGRREEVAGTLGGEDVLEIAVWGGKGRGVGQIESIGVFADATSPFDMDRLHGGGGSALSLWLAREAVRKHHGTVSIEAVKEVEGGEGDGLKLMIRLPVFPPGEVETKEVHAEIDNTAVDAVESIVPVPDPTGESIVPAPDPTGDLYSERAAEVAAQWTSVARPQAPKGSFSVQQSLLHVDPINSFTRHHQQQQQQHGEEPVLGRPKGKIAGSDVEGGSGFGKVWQVPIFSSSSPQLPAPCVHTNTGSASGLRTTSAGNTSSKEEWKRKSDGDGDAAKEGGVTPQPNAASSSPFSSTSLLRCLVVDDSVTNRKVVSASIRRALKAVEATKGTQVLITEFEDGVPAVDHIQSILASANPIPNPDPDPDLDVGPRSSSVRDHDRSLGGGANGVDVVFMDFVMLQMDGPEAARRMREAGYKNPIIGVTGNVLGADVEYFLAAGADEVLAKPLNLAMLKGLLSQIIACRDRAKL